MSKRPNLGQSFNMKRKIDHRAVLGSRGYILGELLGEGTFSKVCVVVNTNDPGKKRVACKILTKHHVGDEFVEKFIPRELRIIRHLYHKHLVSVHNIIDTPGSTYIFMDLCNGGNLQSFIRRRGPLDTALSKHYFRCMVSAVGYLHNLDIAHRDLKGENILLSGTNQLKIADFGLSRFCTNEDGSAAMSFTYCGSSAFAPPEVLKGIPYKPKPMDMWSLGCILFLMTSATMAFDDTNITRLIEQQLKYELTPSPYKKWEDHCIHLRNLISNLLEPEVERRPTIERVKTYAWMDIKNNNCNEVICKSSVQRNIIIHNYVVNAGTYES